MKYTVREINGHFVTVDFENGQWATAQVHHNAQPEDIDKIFGSFVPEFQAAKTPTTRISVGEERCACDPMPETEASAEVIDYDNLPEPEPPPDPFTISFGESQPYVGAVETILLAPYLAERGQPELKAALDAKIAAIADDPEFSVDTLIEKLNDSL